MAIPQPFHITYDDSYFDTYRIDLTFPPPPQVKKPSRMEVVWKKICAFVKKIWNFLCFWRSKSKFKLTDRQLRLIERAKLERNEIPHKPERILKTRKVHVAIPAVTSHQELFSRKYPDDKTLQDFCGFLEEFSHRLIVDTLSVQSLPQMLPDWKATAKEKVGQVKNMIGAVDGLIQAASPLLKQLGNFKNPVLLIFVQDFIATFFVPKPYEIEAKGKKLADKFKERKENHEVNEEQYEHLLSLIQPAIKWLMHPNNSFLKSDHPKILHAFLTDAVEFFSSLARFVKTADYDALIAEVNQEIDNHFEKGILELIQDNTVPLTNVLTHRLSELIGNAPFFDTYNELLDGISIHIDSCITAEGHRLEQEKLIKSSKNDSKQRPEKGKEFDKHRGGKDLLAIVDEAGGEEAYLESEFLKRFSETEGCDPSLREFIRAPSANLAGLIQSETIEKLIDTLIPVLLPQSSVLLPDGTRIEVNGIQRLVDQIQYPDRFQKLFKLYKHLFERVLNDGKFQNQDNLQGYLTAIQKVFLSGIISSRIREKLHAGLKGFIEQTCSKAYLDETVSEVVLPSLISSIIVGWLRMSILEDINKFSVLFHRIIETESNTQITYKELRDAMHSKMRGKMKDFNMGEAGITIEVFKEITDPLVSEIINHLLEKLKTDDPFKKISAEVVAEVLKKYLFPDNVPVVSTYGDIAMKAFFDIGQLKLPDPHGFVGTVLSPFKGTIKSKTKSTMRSMIIEKASVGLYDVGKSHHFILATLIEGGRARYLNPQYLNELINPKELTPQELKRKAENIEKSLKTNFTRIASLIHDIIFDSGWAARLVIPGTPAINDAISRMYQEVFKRPIPNQNLLLKVMQVIGKGLQKGDDNLRARQSLHERVDHLSNSNKDKNSHE